MALFNTFMMVGCGRMGRALLTRWAAHDVAKAFHIIEPDETYHDEIHALGSHIYCHQAISDAVPPSDALLFAVKPQHADSLIPQYQAHAPDALVISIMAGTSLGTIETLLDFPGARVARVMPNTPAIIGEGASVCCGNATVSPQDQETICALFAHAGEAFWLEDEALMHAVTALSGSGPAYLFHFSEALTTAGISLGLPKPLATALTQQMLKGSSLLLSQDNASAAELREQVTSPGGTTEAALSVLMQEGRLTGLMKEALIAAAHKSQDLSK